MRFTIEIAYRDGSIAATAEAFADIHAAALFAVRLADDLGRTVTRYSRGPGTARHVAIRRGDTVEFEIHVFDGGLSPDAPPAGTVDLPWNSHDEPQ